ncbi:MAG: carbohydrate ABC transporter permease [Candidatus Limnocylindrales bacterium]
MAVGSATDAPDRHIATVSTRRGPGPRRSRLNWSRRRAGFLFSLPVILLELGLLGLPILQTFYYSFTNWNGLTSSWVGLDNYATLFSDSTFWQVLGNNALLLASIPVAIVIPLAVAFLLNEHVAGWRFFRSAYFLPTAISWVVIGIVAIRFFAAEGILNGALRAVGLGGVHTDLLSSEVGAMAAVIITFIWSVFGTNTIIFITGMATLDREVYEAARVDGAGAWATLFQVTLPMLRRFIQFAFILTLITAFTALFSLIFVMTSGGPGFGTTTLEFFVYEKAFATGVFGLAAAIGVVLFVIVFGISIAQLRLFRSQVD